MELILKDNALLSLGSTISANIKDNCTSAFIKNCPNVLGINVLRQCANLTRVRVDIGNASGTLSELISFAELAGYSDSGTEQTKPRIVGNFTITDYYTDAVIEGLESEIDGISIDADASAVDLLDVLDNGDMAVQTIDSTKAGYNPAAAIVMDNAGWGFRYRFRNNVMSWCITKTGVSALSLSTEFNNKTTVADTNLIVPASQGDPTAEYEFTDAMWFRHYTKDLTVAPFHNCSLLERLYVNCMIKNDRGITNTPALTHVYFGEKANALTSARNYNSKWGNLIDFIAYKGSSVFKLLPYGSPSIRIGSGSGLMILHEDYISYNPACFKNIVIFGKYTHNNYGLMYSNNNSTEYIFINGGKNICTSVNSGYEINYFSSTRLKLVEIAGTVTGICGISNKQSAPNGVTVHLKLDGICTDTPSYLLGGSSATRIAVGNGDQAHDEALLQQYLAIADWQQYESRMMTWYDYVNGGGFYPSDLPQWLLDEMEEYQQTVDDQYNA